MSNSFNLKSGQDGFRSIGGQSSNFTSSSKKRNENENPYMQGTVKARIFNIEKLMFEVAADMNNHKSVISTIKNEKENIDEIVKKSNYKLIEFLDEELTKVEHEMQRHFERQKKENEDLQKEIIMLKTEKTNLAGEIIAARRKITELEMQIGLEPEEDKQQK